MRAVSLVRYWLYGLRGFVVMTISLAIAFSVAVTGPPTDREIALASMAMGRVAAEVREEIEAASAELCPQLPPEAQPLCAREQAARPPKPPASLPPESEARAPEIAATNAGPPPELPYAQRSSEAQLLGEPAQQRAHRQRAEPRRHAARRENTERRSVVRSRRAPRAEVVARVPPPEPAPAAAVVRWGSDGGDQAPRADASDESDEEREHREWRERRRAEWRRSMERAYEEQEPNAYPEEEEPAYRDEYDEQRDWADGAR